MQQEISHDVSDCGAPGDDHQCTKNRAIAGKLFAAEFLPPDFDRLLAAQIARLIAFDEFRPVGFAISDPGVFRNGLHASHTTTSFSSFIAKALSTRPRTSAINANISFAEARPALTKKFAWRSLTLASPTLKPLSPSSSIIRPVEAPAGFLKIQPALFCPSGWLERRFSLQIRIPWRISLNGLVGSSSVTASIISSGPNEV